MNLEEIYIIIVLEIRFSIRKEEKYEKMRRNICLFVCKYRWYWYNWERQLFSRCVIIQAWIYCLNRSVHRKARKIIISIEGYSYDPDCMYVNGTGRDYYEFYIQLNRCGTLGENTHHQDSRKNPTVSKAGVQHGARRGSLPSQRDHLTRSNND